MMFSAPERMIAGRYLRPTREQGFISVIAAFSLLGIALGVGTLIVVLAVMNGFRAELLDRVLGVNGHATVLAGPEGLADFDPLVERLYQAPYVEGAVAFVEGQVMATANGVSAGALVRGIGLDDLLNQSAISQRIVAGSLDRLGEDESIAVGSRMARRMGLRPGDRLTLISPKGTATAVGTVPRIRSYPIGAIFEVGMYEYDSTFVFVPLDLAQAFFDLADRATGIEVMVDDPEQIAGYRQDLSERVQAQGRIVTWQQTNAQFFNALQVERNVMFLILTLIIVVAAFNIITSLIMLVRAKSKDIAILRTMGATRGAIMRIFFLNGAAIGCGGTLMGFLLGLSFALNIETIRGWLESLLGTNLFAAEIYFLSRLPARVEMADVVSVVAMALVLSLLATLYPSWRAARLDPVEALRYE